MVKTAVALRESQKARMKNFILLVESLSSSNQEASGELTQTSIFLMGRGGGRVLKRSLQGSDCQDGKKGLSVETKIWE